MNKSPNIDPQECRTCGKCCAWFTIGYHKSLISGNAEEQLTLSELHRFLDLETDRIFVLEYPEDFAVVFDYPCKHLENKHGHFTCRIYDKGRPAICEDYPYKPKDCEKYEKALNIFRDSKSFLKRVEEIKGN